MGPSGRRTAARCTEPFAPQLHTLSNRADRLPFAGVVCRHIHLGPLLWLPTVKGDVSMAEFFAYLREFNLLSVVVRLLAATFFGGMLGIDRAKKGRAAGFRTYMFVCLGAALAMLLSQYESAMLAGRWADAAREVGIRTDVSRFGAQVINGIGFLGAGTILVTDRQEVKGLTTAAGLWASACMGLAVGAGFYECVGLAFLLIFLVVHLLPAVELYIVENAKNMNIYVEFQSLDNVAEIISRIKAKDVTIYEVEVDHGKQTPSQHPNAIFSLRMNRPGTHAKILASISELEDVYVVHDI